MTEEEFQRLQAKYGTVEAQNPPAPVGMSDEEFARLEAKFGDTAVVQPPQPTPPPQQQPEATTWQKTKHVLKGVGRGWLDTLETPYNLTSLVDTGLEFAGVEGGLPGFDPSKNVPVTEAVLGTDNYQRLRDAVAGEEIDRQQYPGVDRLRTAAEWGSAGPINLIRKGWRWALADALQGAGAAAGEAAEDYLNAGDAPSGIGETLGGLVTGLTTGRFRTSQADLNEQAAYSFIRAHAADPDTAMDNLRAALDRGDVGTLGDLTGDIKIHAIERASSGADLEFKAKLDGINTKLQAQIAERVKNKFGDADARPAESEAVNAAQETEAMYRAQGEKLKTPAREAADGAKRAANEAAGPVFSPQRTSRTSSALQERLDELDATFKRTNEDPLWKAWRDSADEIDVRPMNDSIDSFMNSLDVAERTNMNNKYGRLIRQVGVWEDKLDDIAILGPDGKPVNAGPITASATPNDITGWLSRINREIDANVRPDGSYTREGALLIQLKKEAENALARENDLFRAAKEATATRHTMYRGGRTGKTRLTGDDSPEMFADKLNLKGTSGAQIARELKAAKDPELIARTVAHLKAEASKPGGNGVDAKFLDDYREIIDALPPEAQRQFTVAAQTDTAKLRALENLDETTKRVDKATDANIKEQQTMPLNRYAANPKAYLKQLLGGTDNGEKLADLRDIMRLRGKEDNFNAALRDAVEDMYLKGGDMSPSVRASTLKDFDNTMQQLRDGGLLSQADIADMKMQMNRSLTLNERVGRMGPQMTKQSGDFQQLKASILAVLTMNAIPGAGGTESLVLTGAIRRFYKHQLDTLGKKPESVEALELMLLDPQRFVNADAKFTIPKGGSAKQRAEIVLQQMLDNATAYVRTGQVAATGKEEE